jgi:hypothetical protein
MSAQDLATYLQACQPAGVPLEDAVQICMRLYSTVDGLPRRLHEPTSRDRLTTVFASLGAAGWVRETTLNVDVSSHAFWATVVTSVTKPARWAFDASRAETAMTPFIGVS